MCTYMYLYTCTRMDVYVYTYKYIYTSIHMDVHVYATFVMTCVTRIVDATNSYTFDLLFVTNSYKVH